MAGSEPHHIQLVDEPLVGNGNELPESLVEQIPCRTVLEATKTVVVARRLILAVWPRILRREPWLLPPSTQVSLALRREMERALACFDGRCVVVCGADDLLEGCAVQQGKEDLESRNAPLPLFAVLAALLAVDLGTLRIDRRDQLGDNCLARLDDGGRGCAERER